MTVLPSGDHRAIAMSLVVPTLLSRATSEGSGGGSDMLVYRETSARLMELASADQVGFRGVVAGMSEGQRAFMEEVIRSGRVKVDEEVDRAGSEKPTIALKMDFGI